MTGALLSYAALAGWLVLPATLATLAVSAFDHANQQHAAIRRSRMARLGRARSLSLEEQ